MSLELLLIFNIKNVGRLIARVARELFREDMLADDSSEDSKKDLQLVLNICSLPMVVEMDSKFSLILHPDPLLNKKSTAKLPTILDSFKPRLTVSGECTWVVTE